jgi:hypothetical protein
MSKTPVTDEDILAEKGADRILDNMCGPEIDTAYGEDLWEEIMRVLRIPNVRERMDAIEDLTLHNLMKKAAERRVKAMIERGDFQ